MAEGPTVLIYEDIEWDDVLKTAAPGKAPPRELVEQAKKTGARRKKLAQGEGGFFMNRSVLPPGFRVPGHKHNFSELMVVLSGGCEFDDDFAALGKDDSIVVQASYRYGFECGPEGMEFLTIRTADAAMSVE